MLNTFWSYIFVNYWPRFVYKYHFYDNNIDFLDFMCELKFKL